MPFTDTEVIDSYENFQKRVAELTADKKEKKNLVIFLFVGNDGENGESWCVDCRKFEDIWKKIQTSKKLPDTGCLIRVKVGSKEEWKGKKDNPFKKDEKLKIHTVPTLMRWGTSKHLSGPDILKIDNVMLLLE